MSPSTLCTEINANPPKGNETATEFACHAQFPAQFLQLSPGFVAMPLLSQTSGPDCLATKNRRFDSNGLTQYVYTQLNIYRLRLYR
jgi:hypothetical protein